MSKYFTRRELLAIAGLVIFDTGISICARLETRFPGDLQLALLMQSVTSKLVFSVMWWVSYFMCSWRAAAIVVTGGIVVWRNLGRLEGSLVLAAGLSSLLDFPLKLAISRPRPTVALVQVLSVEQGNGFPSGHTLFATVVLGFLGYLAIIHLRNRSLRVLSFAGFPALIILTGASRVYLGVHWPSDVLGGYLIGALLLVVLIYSHRMLQLRLEASKEIVSKIYK